MRCPLQCMLVQVNGCSLVHRCSLPHSPAPTPAPPTHLPQDLRAKLLLLSDGDGQQLMRVQEENSQLRRELAARERTIAELEVKLQRVGVPTSGAAAISAFGLSAEPAARAGSLPVPAVGGVGSLSLPVAAPSMPLPPLVSMPSGATTQPQLMTAQQQMPVASLAAQLAPGGVAALPPAPMAPSLPSMGGIAQPTLAVPDASAAAAAAQQQVQALAGVQPQVVVSMAPSVPAAPQVLLQTASGAVQMAQPAATTLSGGAIAAAAASIQPAAPAITTLSNDALSGEAAAAAAASMQALVGAGVAPAMSGEPGVADQAAHTLTQQAAQLTAQASLHAQAKTQASTQAQQLANQAQLHAQASVQAAVQAEQLKQTLAVLPENPQTQQTVATVQDLESKAKAHADITTQVGGRVGGLGRTSGLLAQL